MLEALAAVGGGAFVVACLVVGVRLLLLAMRTGELPELTCGLALVLMGGLGYPLIAIVEQAHGLSTGTRCTLLFAQMLCHILADAAFAYFTYRVFRPGVAWARAMVVVCFAAVVGICSAQLLGPGLVAYVESPVGPWRWHGVAAMLTVGWAAAESGRFYRLLKKRLVLGLADPVVTDRIRLWAVGMTSAFLTAAITSAMEAMGFVVVRTLAGAGVIAVLGSVAAAATWLAFIPPAAYLRRVRARAARAQG